VLNSFFALLTVVGGQEAERQNTLQMTSSPEL